jgi:nucleoside triphosphatase
MDEPMKDKQQYPEPTVGALIFNDQDQLLIVKTHKWHGNYTIPGGHVELGEHLLDAMKREIKEETGLTLSRADFLCFQEFVYDDSFWEQRHFIFFDFLCRVEPGEVKLNNEAEDYIWVDLDQVEEYPIDDYLRHALDFIRENPDRLE